MSTYILFYHCTLNTTGCPVPKLPDGSSRLRWLEDVEKDVREMNVKKWRQKAVGRERWAYVMKEVKALRCPWSQAVSNIKLWSLKNISYRMLPDFRRCIPFFKVLRFCFFVLVLRAACRDKNHMEHCWNDNDKEKRRYWEKIMSHSYLVHHELTCTDARSNTGLRGYRPATDRLGHGNALNFNLKWIYK